MLQYFLKYISRKNIENFDEIQTTTLRRQSENSSLLLELDHTPRQQLNLWLNG